MMKKNRRQQIEHNILKIINSAGISAPAIIPVYGAWYSTTLSQLGSHEQMEFLREIKNLIELQSEELRDLQEELRGIVKDFKEGKLQLEKFIAVVPVGGRGSSMYPITMAMPKALLVVDEKPMLHHVLDTLLDYSQLFESIVVLGREFSSAIEKSLEKYEDKVVYKYSEESVPVALWEMMQAGELNCPVLVHSCDVLINNLDWNKVATKYQNVKKENNNIAGMFLGSSDYTFNIGIIQPHKTRRDIIDEFTEKPKQLPENIYAHVSVFILEPAFFHYVEKEHKSLEDESVSNAMSHGQNFALYVVEEEWKHVHSLIDYLNVQRTNLYEEG